MREQKILNSVVILVVIVSFSASLWVSWLRTSHGAKSGSTAQMSQSVKMSQNVGHTGDPSSSVSSSSRAPIEAATRATRDRRPSAPHRAPDRQPQPAGTMAMAMALARAKQKK